MSSFLNWPTLIDFAADPEGFSQSNHGRTVGIMLARPVSSFVDAFWRSVFFFSMPYVRPGDGANRDAAGTRSATGRYWRRWELGFGNSGSSATGVLPSRENRNPSTLGDSNLVGMVSSDSTAKNGDCSGKYRT